jgi:hypothetical protein
MGKSRKVLLRASLALYRAGIAACIFDSLSFALPSSSLKGSRHFSAAMKQRYPSFDPLHHKKKENI